MRAEGFKVGRPWTATIGAAIAIAGACLTAGVLSLYFGVMTVNGPGLPAGEVVDSIYAFGFVAITLFGAILMLKRKYFWGGALAATSGVVIGIGVWWLGIPSFVGGALGLISREKTSQRILEISKIRGHVRLADAAAMMGKSEAEVELAVVKLAEKGQPIRFDAQKREVFYG